MPIAVFTKNTGPDVYPEVVESLTIASSLKSDDPRINFALGIAHQLADEFSSAINALERIVELEPCFFSAYNSLGLTYKISGEYEKALDWHYRAANVIASAAMESIHNEPRQYDRYEVIDGEDKRGHRIAFFIADIKNDPVHQGAELSLSTILVTCLSDRTSTRHLLLSPLLAQSSSRLIAPLTFFSVNKRTPNMTFMSIISLP